MIRRRKYGNKKLVNADGEFDSKGEYLRWLFLLEAEKCGNIRNLRRQVQFELLPTQYKTVLVPMKTKVKEFDSRNLRSGVASYWSDEMPVYDKEKLDSISQELKIDTVITHTTPSFCELILKDGLKEWPDTRCPTGITVTSTRVGILR